MQVGVLREPILDQEARPDAAPAVRDGPGDMVAVARDQHQPDQNQAVFQEPLPVTPLVSC